MGYLLGILPGFVIVTIVSYLVAAATSILNSYKTARAMRGAAPVQPPSRLRHPLGKPPTSPRLRRLGEPGGTQGPTTAYGTPEPRRNSTKFAPINFQGF
jgi:hypothetical protein